MTTKILGMLAAALLAGPTLASNVAFEGTGTVSPAGSPDVDGNLPLFATGEYAFDGQTGWLLNSSFTFNIPLRTGAGTFNFSRPVDPSFGDSLFGDSLFGTLTTVGTDTGFALNYTITGGTGLYQGTRGYGQSIVTLLGDPSEPPTPFMESGRFTVPEPGTLALLGLGLVGLGLSRRRKAD